MAYDVSILICKFKFLLNTYPSKFIVINTKANKHWFGNDNKICVLFALVPILPTLVSSTKT